ncbi:hypothetical protein Vadar_031662 [Vaccinium darrowii]|uniref:Uncharacterized protein n=1 Tax=Vaccinium darrowii TaxID=229202 RepID=A0ACB7Y3Y9_9ERIC|nr:hypothetical protein Vadar_031662 [Vaccinium darrowii]
MENMKKEDQQACEWLANISPMHWTRSHFKDTVKCDMVCNNLCEAFNRAILEAREKPIIEMLEWIRCYLSKRMEVRKEWIAKFRDELLPNCYSKLEAIKDWSANSSATCYAKAYQQLIKPINGYKMWPKTDFTPVFPPNERRKLGRPKLKRTRDPEEYLNPKDPKKLRRLGQNSVYCRRCGIHGHNKRTCTTPLPEGTEKEGEEHVPSNYAQAIEATEATQGSQASIITTVTNQSSGSRYANTNRLHGVQ